jgi:hypothetical protein
MKLTITITHGQEMARMDCDVGRSYKIQKIRTTGERALLHLFRGMLTDALNMYSVTGADVLDYHTHLNAVAAFNSLFGARGYNASASTVDMYPPPFKDTPGTVY